MSSSHEELQGSLRTRERGLESRTPPPEDSNTRFSDPIIAMGSPVDSRSNNTTTRPIPSPIHVQTNSHESSPNSQRTDHSSDTLFGMDDVGQSPLPEDDGMGVLRGKIHAIRDMEVSSGEKARMVHQLMTESYHSFRGRSNGQQPLIAVTLNLQTSTDSGSRESHGNQPFLDQQPTTPASVLSSTEQINQFNLTPEDIKPTFAPREEPESPLGDGDDMDTEEPEEVYLGCKHYKRNVKLQCFTCKKWYTCRFCHDEVEGHHLIRQKTEYMLCMVCGHAQPAGQWCKECGEQAAQYYCSLCKLWDNDSKKSIYHCNDCGICRIGQGLGKDFFHCKVNPKPVLTISSRTLMKRQTCSVCLPISIENTHRCIERSTQCDCPICGDYMFTSPETVVVMRCGHSIHHKCLSEYSKGSYRCPICSKTITNMESTFRNLDRTIQSQPMPAEFEDTRALIYCNDCGAKSFVKYHWLGLKCDL